MTRFEFYLDRSEDAYKTAKSICQTRREKAGITGLCEADIEMESAMLLQEWYDDYRSERD